MSRRCAGANLSISVRTWASADRRATADWVLPGTSTSTWTERRPEASFFTLMMAPWNRVFAVKGAPRPRYHSFLRPWGGSLRPGEPADLRFALPTWPGLVVGPVLFVMFNKIPRRFDCLLPRFELKNRKSADDLLGLHERPIDRGQLSLRKANTRAHRGRGESAALEHQAGPGRLLGHLGD